MRISPVPVVVGATVLSVSAIVVAVGASFSDSRDSAPPVAMVAAVTTNGVSAGGSARPRTVAESEISTLTAKVKSTTDRTVVVDVEVFAPSGERVSQQSWAGQQLKAGYSSSLSTPWTAPVGAGTYRIAVGVFTNDWSSLLSWNNTTTTVKVTRSATAGASPTASATAGATKAPTSTATRTSTTPAGGTAPSHFSTLAVGATLPSGSQCATWVRSVATPPEIKAANATVNSKPGAAMADATGLNARVDGAFTGTTEQILRWAACKWGVDEDVAKAQAAVESWWRMGTQGDWGSDAGRCAPGHGIGADGKAGQCPESFGLLQIRYPYNQPAFPYAATSSAFNADYAYAQWRNCYVGSLTWLNTVERGSEYAAGDSWGCLGTWFSGRWHTTAAEDYITRVKGYLDQRIWTTADFKQP
ncbi:MAG TPA: hypothetical protein VLL08_08365 [Kineosporiaceae bacterium]|nr:hypothetical protein [Kineosporiaceae bacterium]